MKSKLMTAEELLLSPDNGMQRELIRGVLTEDLPPGDERSAVVIRIGRFLANSGSLPITVKRTIWNGAKLGVCYSHSCESAKIHSQLVEESAKPPVCAPRAPADADGSNGK